MNDWFFKQRGRDRLINWLGIDAWIDSTLAETWERIKDSYDAASSFFARFRLRGWKRLLNEAASEGLSMAVGGFIVLYGLALPAFLEVEEGRWLTTGKYSVKFLDASGNETGCPGEPNYCLTNTGPFVNLQADYYWSGTVYAPDTDRAWWFRFLTGRQESVYRDWGLYAWAVRSGDSAVEAPVVPVPAAAWLLGSALGVLGFVRRQK